MYDEEVYREEEGELEATGSYRVDAHRGSTVKTVSSQWFNRPPDERFLDLNTLYEATKKRAESSRTGVWQSKDLKVHASPADPDTFHLETPDGRLSDPTHWGFGQLCTLVKAPAAYMRTLPAVLTAINLQYGLNETRTENIKTYIAENGEEVPRARAITGPDYGRIYDWEVAQAVRKIAGNGVGDTRWKIPGVLEQGMMNYNPFVVPSKETTTLFASDRDVFIFLVDDTHPIEIGKLPDGAPDLVFRGFYVWNSEVGKMSWGLACMYLRGVCCNRILWGVEGFKEVRGIHSKNAPDRFGYEVYPALQSFADASTGRFLDGVGRAREKVLAKTDEEREGFLKGRGFRATQVADIIKTVTREEGKKPESAWDFVQGITAYARTQGHQDSRLATERVAGRILDGLK